MIRYYDLELYKTRKLLEDVLYKLNEFSIYDLDDKDPFAPAALRQWCADLEEKIKHYFDELESDSREYAHNFVWRRGLYE